MLASYLGTKTITSTRWPMLRVLSQRDEHTAKDSNTHLERLDLDGAKHQQSTCPPSLNGQAAACSGEIWRQHLHESQNARASPKGLACTTAPVQRSVSKADQWPEGPTQTGCLRRRKGSQSGWWREEHRFSVTCQLQGCVQRSSLLKAAL